MGIYNTLWHELTCPRCGASTRVEVDIYCGFCDLIQYEIGDRYQWRPGKSPKNGGRPAAGDCDAEGYAECPLCKRDFFLAVQIRADILVAVELDLSKQPLISD